MTLLDRYLIQQFFKNLLLIVCALLSIYLLVDFFERIDNCLDVKMPVSLAARYFLLKIPFMIDLLQPVCLLLAGILTLGILNHNHEFMALKAGGISTLRIARPIFLSACLVMAGALLIAEWLLPPTFSETERIWNEEVKHLVPKGIVRNGRTYFRGEQGIYSFIRSAEQTGSFTDFSYVQLGRNFKPALFLTAEKAEWASGHWRLHNGQLKTPVNPADNQYDISVFAEQSVTLPETPDDLFAPKYKISERSLSALLASTLDKRGDPRAALVDLHSRLSFILLGMPLIFIGIPVILIVNQKWGHDLTLAIPISCGLAFAAWSWWSTSQSLAKAAYLNPYVAGWAMHLIVCPIGFWLLKRQE